jgi:hypothetical protein
MPAPADAPPIDAELLLPATLLSRYLFFLARRPVSAANAHYRSSRISALQSLGPLLGERVAAGVASLTPANLLRVAPQIQPALQRQLASHTPRDLVVSPHPPAPQFWAGVRRMLVAFGPAIGIGDEVIASTLPRSLRALAPEAEITVLTAYDGLWERIASCEHVETYRDLRALLESMTGGQFDAVVFADFEPPGLVNAMSFEPRVPRFIELALGTRGLTVLDNAARHVHALPPVGLYSENFYFAMDAMLRWLGAPMARQWPVRARSETPVVVVSPFTSKEEPPERLWIDIVLSAIPAGAGAIIDTGPNATTRSFAVALRDAARTAGAPCQLAANGRPASLGEMLDLVRDADVVLTADSYLAHAAPAFGAATMVIAREGLEQWRVPSPSSFYFSSSADGASIGAAIQAVLQPRCDPRERAECRRLAAAIRALRAALDGPLNPLLDAWQRCFDAHNAVVAALAEWPRAYAALFDDQRYGRLMPPAPSRDAIGEDDLRTHLAGRLAECENSNLWKLLW